MKNTNRKMEHKLIHRTQKKYNMLNNCTNFTFNESTVSSFYETNLNRVLLNSVSTYFKTEPWCEWGYCIRSSDDKC